MASQSAGASVVLLGGSGPDLSVHGWCLLKGGGGGRMPGPSLLSSWHLSDIVTSLEKLEMNNFLEKKSFRKYTPSPGPSPQ